jgi:hypothetical protein
VQRLEHFNVPLYPFPIILAQVAPPKAELSHFSVPSIFPLPHVEETTFPVIYIAETRDNPKIKNILKTKTIFKPLFIYYLIKTSLKIFLILFKTIRK